MADPQAQGPRNIVLLSDGTGNSSAKLMKTNVWRMYEALDLSTGDQLAMYDNGVGTSSFKPLAILGGGLGWGLKRNVRDLYMFACRNYRAGTSAEQADRLYAFGFSRGAFTIRVLAGLIESQGLITGVQGPELKRLAKWAYRDYRRQFKSKGGLVTAFRWVRDAILNATSRKPRYDKSRNTPVRMSFLGLWDTVDAYGLPIDEMTRGWDQWVWPLSMCEREAKVADKVCHAVALDDERHTFHPVLLTEADQPMSAHTDDERVTQVWFAGVHSNVGGGYPDDSLSFVSLRWMAGEATKRKLRLHQSITEQWKARVDPHGPIFDSRGGLGAYYRYNPRSIRKLTDDPFDGVLIPRPKIHHTVFDRIRANHDEYAPLVLPERYAIVDDTGAVLDGASNTYEDASQSAARAVEQERAWNLVWGRRVLYFATVLLTVALFAPPLFYSGDPGRIAGLRTTALSGVVDAIGGFAPSFASPWVEYYRTYPVLLLILVLPLLLLMRLSTVVQRAAGDRMRHIWTGITATPPRQVPAAAPLRDPIFKLRTHPAYQRSFELLTRHVFPFAFGIATLVLAVWAGLGTVNRGLFAAAGATGQVCTVEENGRKRPVTPVAAPTSVWLPANEPCFFTGIQLEAGVTYRVRTVLPGGHFNRTTGVVTQGSWKDGESQEVRGPEGFSSGENWWVALWLPFRRALREQWFVPVARIGDKLAEYHPLNQNEVEITPHATGPLFLFVNDAVFLLPDWKRWYRNNDVRRAEVIVERIGAAPSEPKGAQAIKGAGTIASR